MEPEGRPHPGQGRHADAQLRHRADAVRPAVPGRRCRAHRAADRRQGAQPGPRRRGRAGRRGLNLALADVAVLAGALGGLLRGDRGPADAYSATCLDRVWRSTHFSWWMTSMLHATPGADAMEA